MFLLRVLAGERVVETHHCQGSRTVIRRDELCDVPLTHAGVSRRHAAITCDGGDCVIEDLGSTNGVEVNGSRVTRRRLLHGDLIALGTARLEFSTRMAMPTGRKASVEGDEVELPAAGEFVAVPGSRVYHRRGCPAIAKTPPGVLQSLADSRRAREKGRRPCRRCLPRDARGGVSGGA